MQTNVEESERARWERNLSEATGIISEKLCPVK
jgi:hypothetical protein